MEGTLDFFLLEWKHNEEKVAEEYCWVITQAAGRSCCGRLHSCVLEVGFHFDCLAYTDIQSVPGGMCQTSGGCSLC
jgi:hypothetical protein